MATTEQPKSLSETEKLAATLAQLEREREQRIASGRWSRASLPMLMAVPRAGEALEAAQQRALYAYLADHPDAPKAIAAYDWMELEVIDPAPAVETQPYAPDHADSVDVTPPHRPPSHHHHRRVRRVRCRRQGGNPIREITTSAATLPPPSAAARRDSRVTTGAVRQNIRCATRAAIAADGEAARWRAKRLCLQARMRTARR